MLCLPLTSSENGSRIPPLIPGGERRRPFASRSPPSKQNDRPSRKTQGGTGKSRAWTGSVPGASFSPGLSCVYTPAPPPCKHPVRRHLPHKYVKQDFSRNCLGQRVPASSENENRKSCYSVSVGQSIKHSQRPPINTVARRSPPLDVTAGEGPSRLFQRVPVPRPTPSDPNYPTTS